MPFAAHCQRQRPPMKRSSSAARWFTRNGSPIRTASKGSICRPRAIAVGRPDAAAGGFRRRSRPPPSAPLQSPLAPAPIADGSRPFRYNNRYSAAATCGSSRCSCSMRASISFACSALPLVMCSSSSARSQGAVDSPADSAPLPRLLRSEPVHVRIVFRRRSAADRLRSAECGRPTTDGARLLARGKRWPPALPS